MYAMLAKKAEGLSAEIADFTQSAATGQDAAWVGKARANPIEQAMRAVGCDSVTDDTSHAAGTLLGRGGGPTVLLLDASDARETGRAGLAVLLHAILLIKRAFLPMNGHLVVATACGNGNGSQPDWGQLLNETLPSLDMVPDYAVINEAAPCESGDVTADWDLLDSAAERNPKRASDGKRIDMRLLDPYYSFLLEARQALTDAGLEAHPALPRPPSLGAGTPGGILIGKHGIPTLAYGSVPKNGNPGAPSRAWTETLAKGAHGIAVIAHRLAGIPVCGWTLDDI